MILVNSRGKTKTHVKHEQVAGFGVSLYVNRKLTMQKSEKVVCGNFEPQARNQFRCNNCGTRKADHSGVEQTSIPTMNELSPRSDFSSVSPPNNVPSLQLNSSSDLVSFGGSGSKLVSSSGKSPLSSNPHRRRTSKVGSINSLASIINQSINEQHEQQQQQQQQQFELSEQMSQYQNYQVQSGITIDIPNFEEIANPKEEDRYFT
jgi:hypothetical protein